MFCLIKHHAGPSTDDLCSVGRAAGLAVENNVKPHLLKVVNMTNCIISLMLCSCHQSINYNIIFFPLMQLQQSTRCVCCHSPKTRRGRHISSVYQPLFFRRLPVGLIKHPSRLKSNSVPLCSAGCPQVLPRWAENLQSQLV